MSSIFETLVRETHEQTVERLQGILDAEIARHRPETRDYPYTVADGREKGIKHEPYCVPCGWNTHYPCDVFTNLGGVVDPTVPIGREVTYLAPGVDPDWRIKSFGYDDEPRWPRSS